MSVPISAPRTHPLCREMPTGMHAIEFVGKCLLCLPPTRRSTRRYDDDGGDTVIRQTRMRRDRYGRAR